MAQIGTLTVGTIVKIPVNGVLTDFLIVHQGNPNTSMYDRSCNGTWLVSREPYGGMLAKGTSDYKSSALHTYLNQTFLGLLSGDVRGAIKQVKIPYWNGTSSNGSLSSGASGLSCKVFALSARELGCTHTFVTSDGSRLDFFGSSSRPDSSRVCAVGGTPVEYSTRSAYDNASYSYDNYHIDISSTGNALSIDASSAVYVRPAFILPSTQDVNTDGTVNFNTPPTVTTSTTSLGIQNEPFAWRYTVSDAEGDPITVREYLDGSLVSTHSGLDSGMTMTFGHTNNTDNFRRILNGSHTLTVIPADSYSSGTSLTASWTKDVRAASITLAEPLSVAGDIEVAILSVSGSIPADAAYKVEVTNNALDPNPVWQDCTEEVKAGENIVFENRTNANGAAFNFRISVSRGASETGGHIDAVRGAFQ